MKRVKVKMKKYEIIRSAVENGCTYASLRFSKHLDGDLTLKKLDRAQLAEVFEQAVMGELCEVVDFESGLE